MSFRHDETGTPESLWQQHLTARRLPAASVDRPRRLLVLAAHPDDETLGAGGLMAAVTDAGGSVVVVVATDGEASHPHSPTWTPQTLATERRRELRLAIGRVAPSARIDFLGVPDGRVAEHVDVVTRALAQHDVDLIAAPWRHDGHPDHAAAGLAAAVAVNNHAVGNPVVGERDVDLWEYPIWFWHWGGDDLDALPWPDTVRLELTAEQRERKQQAMAEHHTQVAALSPAAGDEVLLGEHVLSHFRRGFETFVRSG